MVVFQQSSRGENTILDILPSNEAETVSFGSCRLDPLCGVASKNMNKCGSELANMQSKAIIR